MASAWSIYSNIFYPSKLMIEIILATSSYPFINLVLAQHSSPIYTFSTFKNRLLWVFKIQYSIFSRHLNSDLRSGIVCEILHIFSHSLIWAKICPHYFGSKVFKFGRCWPTCSGEVSVTDDFFCPYAVHVHTTRHCFLSSPYPAGHHKETRHSHWRVCIQVNCLIRVLI